MARRRRAYAAGMPVALVLASASPARAATLTRAGVTPVVRVSGIDEDVVLAEAEARYGPLDPVDVALLLAQAKAVDVSVAVQAEAAGAGRHAEGGGAGIPEGAGIPAGGALVLGCDSVLELDGQTHGKPASADEARARWRAMRGRSGMLHTGHWLIDDREASAGGTGATLGATATTTVHFADLSDGDIDAYVATGEPLRVAGAFTIDGLGGPFVRGLEGDPHNVVGLSLPLLRDLLGEIGVSWFELG